jgi:hypothetical protein
MEEDAGDLVKEIGAVEKVSILVFTPKSPRGDLLKTK